MLFKPFSSLCSDDRMQFSSSQPDLVAGSWEAMLITGQTQGQVSFSQPTKPEHMLLGSQLLGTPGASQVNTILRAPLASSHPCFFISMFFVFYSYRCVCTLAREEQLWLLFLSLVRLKCISRIATFSRCLTCSFLTLMYPFIFLNCFLCIVAVAEISAQNDAFLYYCEYGCLLSCSERCLWQPGPWIQAHLRQTGTSHAQSIQYSNNSRDEMCFCGKKKVSKKTAISAYIQTKINTSHLYLQCPLAD